METTRTYSPTPEDFKDTTGRWRTESLFMETNPDEDKYISIFTLADHDKNDRISMRAIYLAANDPTEYTAAMQIFGSLDCWTRLTTAPFFRPHLANWRAELQNKIKSGAVSTISSIADGTDATNTQLSAAKWLASQSWVGPNLEKPQRGRPVKSHDPAEALREGLREQAETDHDFDRIIHRE